MEKQNNHICRTCGKHYYACPDCDSSGSWRSVACSIGCYDKYIDAVLAARGELESVVDQTIERTDMEPGDRATEEVIVIDEPKSKKK